MYGDEEVLRKGVGRQGIRSEVGVDGELGDWSFSFTIRSEIWSPRVSRALKSGSIIIW